MGFGLGGFFDGILLHQILEWHHLLSGVQQARLDIRFLIMTDGLFHLLMYLMTVIGIYLLLRSRAVLGQGQTKRIFSSYLLTGFGVWHIVDAIFSHWVLGLHHIRMDAENPLVWDVVWLLIFGVLPCLAGYWMRRNGSDGGASKVAALTVFIAILAGGVSIFPVARNDVAIVLFHPMATPVQAFAAVRSAGGEILWTDSSQQVWVLRTRSPNTSGSLYKRGAILVSNNGFLAGCLNWMKES
ncbi:DUF2243 domain-containing protein [Limoniibacter endophyticus]|nr:DUF2243 domain-containing protein [Limoniibacter endophyticus]